MKVTNITTMDEEITFKNAEIENINTAEELDNAIADGKVLSIIEDKKKYKLNSLYIIYYME